MDIQTSEFDFELETMGTSNLRDAIYLEAIRYNPDMGDTAVWEIWVSDQRRFLKVDDDTLYRLLEQAQSGNVAPLNDHRWRRGEWTYRIDWSTKEQINIQTGTGRSIQRRLQTKIQAVYSTT